MPRSNTPVNTLPPKDQHYRDQLHTVIMAFQQTSPMVKFENSPAESFISTPGDSYTSLFAAATPSAANTMNPMEMMTPKSFTEEKPTSSSAVDDLSDEEDESPAPSGDKKSAKKRKSWGQVLPEPKTNLPPRKRAKTEDEKEQRRVERVLRNRRAAQSSRERKRLEVEALEKRNKELESMLINAQKANLMLVEELNRFRRSSGVVTRSSSPLDSLRDNPVTLSQELFSSQDGHKPNSESSNPIMDDILISTATVNPASLSPELGPVDDSSEDVPEQPSTEAQTSEMTSASSPDLTQCPAETLCDLQCQSSAEMPKSFLVSQTSMAPALAWLQLRMMLLSVSAILSACQRPLTQIAMSSKAGFSLLPTPPLLTTIIWLVTLPPASRINPTSTCSTSTTSSSTKQTLALQTLWQRATSPLRTMNSTSRSTTLRLKSLQKILSSSPSLARPLSDATLVALRLVSEGRDDRVGNLRRESNGTRGDDSELTRCLSGIALPSKDVLLTLLWALKVEERRIRRRSGAALDPETRSQQHQPAPNYKLEVGEKRKMADVDGSNQKRCRLS